MNYCDEMESLLSVYFDGECTPQETTRIRAHLRTCPACRQQLRDYALSRKYFPDDRDISVPRDLSEKVLSAISSRQVFQQKRRCVWKKILLPLAACLILALTLPGFSTHLLENQPSGSAVPERVSSSATKITKQKKQVSTAKKFTAGAADKPLSSQKSSVADSAAPDETVSSAETASESGGTAANTYDVNHTAAFAPYHKWVSVTSDAAGSLLDSFSGAADTDPVSGQSAMRYELSADDFSAVTAQIAGISIYTNSSAQFSLCCIYVLTAR